jgi:hypothetical protein
MKVASSPCTIRRKPVSRRRAHSGALVPPDWGWLAPHPSTNNHSILVCTLLQSRKVLVSVVWATSSARRADWGAARTDSCSGSAAHHHIARELGPVAHARPPSMAYAPLSPYDRPAAVSPDPTSQQKPDSSFLRLGLGDRQELRFANPHHTHTAGEGIIRIRTHH